MFFFYRLIVSCRWVHPRVSEAHCRCDSFHIYVIMIVYPKTESNMYYNSTCPDLTFFGYNYSVLLPAGYNFKKVQCLKKLPPCTIWVSKNVTNSNLIIAFEWMIRHPYEYSIFTIFSILISFHSFLFMNSWKKSLVFLSILTQCHIICK